MSETWVFSEKAGLLSELISAARQLGSPRVVALVVGSRDLAEQAIARGANHAIWLGETSPQRLVDDFVPTLAQLVQRRKPGILLVGSTRRGKAVAGRLAARLGVSALTDALELRSENNALVARHMIFGGGAVRVDRSSSATSLVTVAPGVYDASPVDSTRSGEVEEVNFIEPDWRATLREIQPLPKASVHLEAARRVIAAGRGISKQEDLAMVEELARLLGAEVACTRPLAEGLGWLPVERYIGISGATVKPDLYLGIGVSGQVQHMIGMYGSRVVAAINKDSNAPIFAQADYGIAADLYSVLPALIEALKQR